MFSWIIQNIIGSLPVWVWTFVAGTGVAAYFVSGFIAGFPSPQLKMLSVTVKYSGLAAIVFGVFMCGGSGVTAVWQAEIKRANEQVVIAEKKAADANNAIKEKVITKIEIVKEKANANNQAIEANRSAINAECKLSDTAWVLYNRAVKNEVAGSTSRTTTTSK